MDHQPARTQRQQIKNRQICPVLADNWINGKGDGKNPKRLPAGIVKQVQKQFDDDRKVQVS